MVIYCHLVVTIDGSMKNKEQTKARIVSAVGELIAEKGFLKVGVNTIARQAGVDKVLIYRYFDGLDGLFKAYANSSEFWPSVDELLGDEQDRASLIEKPYADVLALFFKRFIGALRSRPLTLEIMAWETIERNALTIALEEVRETFGLEMASQLQQLKLPEADWLAITNVFSGALMYFILRGRKIRYFSGMDLNDDESWERLTASMQWLMKGIE